MKKLLFLSIIALFSLASANVYGQAGDQPSIGSSHTYWVNGSATTHDAGHVGSQYTWWISTDIADLTQIKAVGGEFTPSIATDYNTATANLNKITLVWNASSVGQTYFLVVKEEGTGALCTNIKAYAIKPKNNFEVQFVLVNQSSIDADASSFCAPDIALSADAATSTIAYNYGSKEYLFKLHSTGMYNAWSFGNVLTNPSSAITTVDYKVGSGSWSALTSTGNINANLSGIEDVVIRVTVNNGISTGTYEEGKVQQLIKLVLSNVKDANNISAKITNSAGTDITATPAQTQTVKARPATSGILSN